MSEEIIKHQFFPTSSNFYVGIFSIIAGVILLFFALRVGGGVPASIMLIIAGIIMLVKRNKPLITFYDDYVDAVGFKKLYVDIENVERKKNICTVYFVEGKKKKINLTLFDHDSGDRIVELFEEIVNNNLKKEVINGK